MSTENGLSMNGLSMNGLSMNGLSMNGLSMNGLTTDGLDGSNAERLLENDESLMLLKYLVKCALPEGEVLRIEHEVLPTEELPGLFGVAPNWTDSGLTDSEKQAMSACLLAHVNAYGISVPVSARRHGLDDTTEDERSRFSRFEGAFFGRLFDEDPVMYACGGAPAPDFSVAYPDHDKSDRLIRRCTDVEDPSSAATLCGFTNVGSCSDVCDTEVGGSYRDCQGPDGNTYGETMNTWLLSGDDPNSAWPEHYDAIFGPPQ